MKKNKKKGFTLVEIIVVMAIIVVLSAVGAVSYFGYIKHSKDTICRVNRVTILNMFRYQKQLNEKLTLDDTFLEGYTCPAKGTYYIEDDEVLCTIHESEESGSGGGTELPEGSIDIGHTDGTTLSLAPTMTLEEIKKAIQEKGSITLSEGTVIADATGTYIMGKNETFTSSNLGGLTTLADAKATGAGLLQIGKEEDVMAGMVDADIYDYFYKESDFVLNQDGKWGIGALSYNELVFYDGKLYLTKKEIHDSKIIPPNSTYYVEIIQ